MCGLVAEWLDRPAYSHICTNLYQIRADASDGERETETETEREREREREREMS